MKIRDKVYGDSGIDDPLLIKLIRSDPVQRLKGVMQGGSSPLIDERVKITRYDHSLGVMILLRAHQAPLEEQAAGLLHDVGHAAFSHVVDSLFKEYNHNYDDAHAPHVIEYSKIPQILEKFGIDWKKIVKKENYSLLEQPLPRLCADRIDYALRDSSIFTSEEQRARILENITQYHGEFAFKTYESAREFTSLYRELNEQFYENPRHGLAYEILAESLKMALEKNILTKEDLRLTDHEVMEKMKRGNDPRIEKNLRKLAPTLHAEIASEKPDYVHTIKIREIDPLIWDGMRALYLSQIDTPLREKLEGIKKNPYRDIPLRIVEW